MSLTYRFLSIPFRNPFLDQRSSHEDFAQFGREVMASLQVNAASLGISQAQVDGYAAALNQYTNLLGSENIGLASRLGASLNLREAWKMVLRDIRSKEAWVRSKFDRKSAEYITIFPRGLTPFQQPKRGDQVMLLHQVQNSFALYEAMFPGAASSVEALKEQIGEAIHLQAGKKGSLGGLRLSRNLARTALAGQLHELWLTLALNHRGQPDMVKVLFNVSIFNKGTNYANDKLGRLFLLVLDGERRPVVNAKVEVRTLENQIVQKGLTRAEGLYKGRKLEIGFYEATVKQVGMKTWKGRFQVFDHQDPVREVVLELE